MRAISVKPPWAYLFFGWPWGMKPVKNKDGSTRLEAPTHYFLKDTENRSWPIPKHINLPQRIIIHVSTRPEPMTQMLDYLYKKLGMAPIMAMLLYSTKLPKGALLGEADLVRCVRDSKSPWAEAGMYHWQLSNPVAYPEPIPYRGQLGLFEVTL